MRTKVVVGLALVLAGLFLWATGLGVSGDLPFGWGGLMALVGFGIAFEGLWHWAREKDRAS